MRYPHSLTRCGALVALVAIAALLGATPALAADSRTGDRVVIARNEVVGDDLYVAATTIVVDGTIKGDLIAVGSSITVNGTVEGDVLVAGQAVVLNGALQDDVRVAGQAVQFGPNVQVRDDVTAAAGSIEQQAGASFGADAYLAASQALLSGTTAGQLNGAFGGVELRGTFGGDVNLEVGSTDTTFTPWSPGLGISAPAVRGGLTVDDGARINGRLSYTSAADARIGTDAEIVSGAVRTPAATTAPTVSSNAWLVAMLRRYVTLMAVGLLLVWLAPVWLSRLGATVRERPLASAGWGAVGFVGTIVLLVLLPLVVIALMVMFGMLTLGGLAGITFLLGAAVFSSLLTAFGILISYVVQAVVGVLVGRWLLGRIDPRWAERRVAPLALGLALYVVVRAVPILGTLTALAVTLLGLGALWQWLSLRLRRAPQPAPIAA